MYKANFRLVSPLLVDCLTQPGVEYRDEDSARRFWESVCRKSGATYARKVPQAGSLQYESAQSIDVQNDIAIVKNSVHVDKSFCLAQDPTVEINSVEWSLCDFGILLIEIELAVGIERKTASSVEQLVQKVASRINQELIAGIYDELRTVIQKHDGYEKFVLFQGDKPIEDAWASRALIFDPSESEYAELQSDFALEWLGNTNDKGGIVESLRQQQISHTADWMNYIYLKETSDNRVEVQEMWKALVRAQFFYAATGRSDSNLMNILSWAMSQSSDISTSKLREQLRQEMDFAEALFLKKSEVGKYVNPMSRLETARILEVWDYSDVLEKPVQAKLRICQTRLDDIDGARARSASFFTDLILMVIGVTSILGTMLAVVSLGRSTTADPDQTIYDLGASDLTTWIATQPVDVILLISTIISLLMVLAFVIARKKSES